MTRPSAPTDPAKLLDAALDVFVYAPIGFLLDAREVVPKLAERGKGQVALARLFGRYAVKRGQAEADRLLKARNAPPQPQPAPPPEPARTPAPAAPARAAATKRKAKAPAKAPAKRKRVVASALAIPGYDALSASQVVPRLDALRASELEAVRAYEAAHRGRRTILNRIAQLQA
jgi:hypothetical protein